MRGTLLVIIPLMAALMLVAVAVADDGAGEVGPMVDRPDSRGTMSVGHNDTTIRFSTKAYDTQFRIFYPATADGIGTPPDISGAPYMTVVWFPFAGGTHMTLDPQCEQLASWGAVVVAYGVNWEDREASGNPDDMNELLDMLEDLNATNGHFLFGMVDKEAFGVCGYSSGGGISLITGAQVPRIKAIQSWAAAIYNAAVDGIAPMFNGRPLLLQVGKDDVMYIQGSRRAYLKVGAPCILVEILGASHGGPFQDHMYIAFFLYHLQGDDDYRTFLYGDEAVADVANGLADIYFKLGGDHFFPPVLTTSVSARYTPMDVEVTFNATIRGYQRDNDPILVHAWDVDGDGNPEALSRVGPNVTYAFTAPGRYSVRYVYNLGAFHTQSAANLVDVSNVPPVAVAGTDVDVDHDGYIELNGEASTDTASDTARLLYKWTFSDGPGTSVTSHPTVSRQFTEVGVIVATLTVYDPHGGEASDTLNVTVVNVPPTVTTDAHLTVVEDMEALFNGTGNDTASHWGLLRYKWDFGDDMGTEWMPTPEATHAYTRSGNYTATLHVRDPVGAEGTVTTLVEVLNEDPEGTIVYPVPGTSFDKETPVKFKATGTDTPSDEVDLRFMWDFGDGEATDWLGRRDTEVFHTYTVGGVIEVTLTVRDSDWAIHTTTSTITIANPPPEAMIVRPWPTATVDEDTTVKFKGTGTDTPGDEPGLTYEWVIDGINYDLAEVEHTFTKAGVFDCEFRVTDIEGAIATLTVGVTVENVVPVVTIDIDHLDILAGGTIMYKAVIVDSISDMGDHSIVWDLGDGGTSYDANGTHEYPSNGSYRVTVTVEDDDGDIATTSVTITVTDPPQEPVDPNDGDGPSAHDGMDETYLLIGGIIAVLVIVVLLVVFHLMRKDMTVDEGEELQEETREGKDPD